MNDISMGHFVSGFGSKVMPLGLSAAFLVVSPNAQALAQSSSGVTEDVEESVVPKEGVSGLEQPLVEDSTIEPSSSPDSKSQAGVPLLMTAVAGWSAYSLGTVGALGRNPDVGVPSGIITGALVGAGSTYLLTRGRDVSAERAGAIINSEAWGTSIGWLSTAAQYDVLDNPGRVGAVYGALGMGAGLVYGAVNQEADFRGINLGGLSGSMGSLGLNLLIDAKTSEQALLATGGSTLLGLGEMGLGIMLDRGEPMSASDGSLAFHLTTHSTWMGLWAPGFVTGEPNADERLGLGLVLGSGALVASQVLAPRFEPDVDSIHAVSLATTYGYLAGGGMPLFFGLIGDRSDSVGDAYWSSLGVIGGGALGLGAGLLHNKTHDEDAPGMVHLAGAGLGLAHGLIIGNAFSSAGNFSDEQYVGAALAATGAGGMVGLLMPAGLENSSAVTPWAVATGLGWGAWYGGWTAGAVGADRPWVLTAGLLAGDLGAGLGAFATKKMDIEAQNLGYVSLCGVGGVAIANVVALAVVEDVNDTQAIATANLIGGTTGLVAGVLSKGILDKLAPEVANNTNVHLPHSMERATREFSRWNPRFEVRALPVLNASPGEELPMGAMLSFTQPVN